MGVYLNNKKTAGAFLNGAKINGFVNGKKVFASAGTPSLTVSYMEYPTTSLLSSISITVYVRDADGSAIDDIMVSFSENGNILAQALSANGGVVPANINLGTTGYHYITVEIADAGELASSPAVIYVMDIPPIPPLP